MKYIVEENMACFVLWTYQVDVPDDIPETDRKRVAEEMWRDGACESLGVPSGGVPIKRVESELKIYPA